jgi:hypothetical protein
LYKYARYFARRHPKIVDDEKAVEMVLRLEEQNSALGNLGRRLAVTAAGVNVDESLPQCAGRATIAHLGSISEVHNNDVAPTVPAEHTRWIRAT